MQWGGHVQTAPEPRMIVAPWKPDDRATYELCCVTAGVVHYVEAKELTRRPGDCSKDQSIAVAPGGLTFCGE